MARGHLHYHSLQLQGFISIGFATMTIQALLHIYVKNLTSNP